MKNYEKVLMKIFGGCIGLFIMDLIYQCVIRGHKLRFNSYDNVTFVLSMLFAASVFGIITVIMSNWMRSRIENGENPISREYRMSFFLSFVPFLLILALSIFFSITGFRFFRTTYGLKAIHDTFEIYGYYVFGIIIPVFPICIFWQVLYIVKSITYRNFAVNNKKLASRA